jgi:hypothetical protein
VQAGTVRDLVEMITLKILVHEFTTLDGVIDAPTWTSRYPLDQDMGTAIGGIMESGKALLPLGRWLRCEDDRNGVLC